MADWSNFPSDLAIGVVGILGGIAGTVVGVLLDRWLKSRGRTTILCHEWRVHWLTLTPSGERNTTRDDADRARLIFTLELFNTRDEPTALHDVRLELLEGSKCTARLELTEGLKREFHYVNLAPKQWLRFELNVTTGVAEEFNSLRGPADRAELVALTPEGTQLRALVTKSPGAR